MKLADLLFTIRENCHKDTPRSEALRMGGVQPAQENETEHGTKSNERRPTCVETLWQSKDQMQPPTKLTCVAEERTMHSQADHQPETKPQDQGRARREKGNEDNKNRMVASKQS